MSPWTVALREAAHEFSTHYRSPVVPALVLVFTGYTLLVLGDAQMVREWGASGTLRNGAHITYVLASGQSFWLIFALAYLFAQPALRDRRYNLHELILASPAPLLPLLAGRFIGAVLASLPLGASGLLGLSLAPLLETLGAAPPGSFGPVQVGHLAWAFLLLVVPTVVGLGALYFALALRLQSLGAALATAACVMLLWMFTLVILRDGELGGMLATLLDATAYGECDAQTKLWSPHEKQDRYLELSGPLFANRALWSLGPLGLLTVVLARSTREALVLPRERATRRRARAAAPSWGRRGGTRSALLSEAAFHLSFLVGSRATWGAFALLGCLVVGALTVHGLGHADGPFLSAPERIAPVVIDFTYFVVALGLASSAGLIVRRDEAAGQAELLGTLPAPHHTVLLAKALGVFTLVVLVVGWVTLCTTTLVVTGFPGPVSLGGLALTLFGDYLPALLEVVALSFLLHATLRSAALAYTMSALLTFILIVNRDVGLVEYPPAQLGLPLALPLSELLPASVYAPRLLTGAAAKLGVVLVALGLSMWFAPSGLNRGLKERARTVKERLRSVGSAATLVGLVLVLAASARLHLMLVTEGGHRTAEDRQHLAAESERAFASRVGPIDVRGGEVEVRVSPVERHVHARWRLRGVRAPHGLHLTLPRHAVVKAAFAEGAEGREPVVVEQAHDEAHVALPACREGRCEEGHTITLEVTTSFRGWPEDGEPPKLTEHGAWLTAEDILPCLGTRPDRRLRDAATRGLNGLPADVAALPASAACVARGVAPPGRWRWSVVVDPGAPGAWSTPEQGARTGPLRFSFVWLAKRPQVTVVEQLTFVHGEARHGLIHGLAEDARVMGNCLKRRGLTPRLGTVVQAPRGRGDASIDDGVLWLPESPSWDLAGDGRGRWLRRYVIARAIAEDSPEHDFGGRRSAGNAWVDGLPSWHALACLGETTGEGAFRAVYATLAENALTSLVDSPVVVGPVEQAEGEAWLTPYVGLAVFGWAEARPVEVEQLRLAATRAVAHGTSVAEELQVIDSELSSRLLGPPRASDVRASVNGANALVERWQFIHGGWESVPVDDHGTAFSSILDAWPSIELTIEDNVVGPRQQTKP